MLVILSDLHLTDGAWAPTLPASAIRVLAERIQDLALRASWRADGRYRPVEQIDLVLLGDIFDFTRAGRWTTGAARPWHAADGAGYADTVQQIAGDILRHNAEALTMLRALGEGAIRVPLASLAGQPVHGAEGQPIPVRTHYLVGDCDWYLRLAGPRFDAIRAQIAQHAGLILSEERPVAHDPAENEIVLEALRQHRVLARHGDVRDPLSCGEDRSQASIADVLAVELIGRFIAQALRDLGEQSASPLATGLRELDHVRPLPLAPVFLASLLERMGVAPAAKKHLKQLWDSLADEVLSLDVLGELSTLDAAPLRDTLADALLFRRRPATNWAARTSAALHAMRGTDGDSYAAHALAEPEFRNRRARHVVYGHTHVSEIAALDASFADGNILPQIYFNCGTWRRIYQSTRLASGHDEFLPGDCLNLLSFYQGDERQGRPYELWQGTLGVSAAETSHKRIDAAAPGTPARGAQPTLRAPHFHGVSQVVAR